MASVETQAHAEFIEIRPQTDALQSLIQETQQEVRDQVAKVPAEPTIVIQAPSNSTMILEEYRKSYYLKVSDDPPLQHILDPTRITRRYNPTVFVLQAGNRHFGNEGAAVIITLCRSGDLETYIESPDRRRVKWEPDQTITFLAGGSRLESSGSGKVACLVIGYEQRRPQPPTIPPTSPSKILPARGS